MLVVYFSMTKIYLIHDSPLEIFQGGYFLGDGALGAAQQMAALLFTEILGASWAVEDGSFSAQSHACSLHCAASWHNQGTCSVPELHILCVLLYDFRDCCVHRLIQSPKSPRFSIWSPFKEFYHRIWNYPGCGKPVFQEIVFKVTFNSLLSFF